jgi:hypothetical protein
VVAASSGEAQAPRPSRSFGAQRGSAWSLINPLDHRQAKRTRCTKEAAGAHHIALCQAGARALQLGARGHQEFLSRLFKPSTMSPLVPLLLARQQPIYVMPKQKREQLCSSQLRPIAASAACPYPGRRLCCSSGAQCGFGLREAPGWPHWQGTVRSAQCAVHRSTGAQEWHYRPQCTAVAQSAGDPPDPDPEAQGPGASWGGAWLLAQCGVWRWLYGCSLSMGAR